MIQIHTAKITILDSPILYLLLAANNKGMNRVRERKVRLFRKGVENVGSTKGIHFKTSDSTAAKIERLGVRIRQFQSKLESLT